jgi:hypothetical protein
MHTLRLLPVMFVALCATTVFAQKTTLQLQDASGDRLIIETGTLTANRTTTLPDASGMLMVSGAASLDNLTDAMSNGTNFFGSVLIGNQISPSANAPFNTGVGADVFSNAFTGSENVAVGRLAGSDLTSGSRNVLIGGAAGTGLTTGNNNTIIGNLAGSSLIAGSNNVFLGYGAGFNETGSNKLYIDNSSTSTPLIYGDFGSDYVTINGTLRIAEPPASGTNYTAFVGQAQSGDITYTLPATAPTTGQALIAGPTPTTLVWGAGGAEKIDDLTDAKSGGANFTNSLLLGHQNVPSISSADQNVAVGGATIQGITTGDGNTAMGYSALVSVTSGSDNVALGHQSMRVLTTGSSNVAVGSHAMYDASTTGYHNIAIGVQSGWELDGSAYENTAVGARIFRNQITGNRNTAVGADAMYNGGTGSFNTVLGFGALQSITTGSNNVVIGSQAGLVLQTGSGNVFLGHNAGWSETGSDKLYIDNSSTSTPLIYGDFSSNNLTVNGALTLMAATSDYNTSNVDAGNLTQTYLALGEAGTGNDYAYLRQIGGANLYHLALDFHDDANDARFSIRSVQSSGQTPDIITTRFMLDVNGRVGIGTDAPDYMLDVTTTVNQALGLTTTNNDVTGMLVMDVENAPAAGTGQNQEFVFFQTLGVTRGAIRYDGTNLLYENLSDYRLKEDLQQFNALSLVRQIPVYDFKWKQSEMRTYGFMAHELQATVPYLVSGEKDAVDDKGRPQYQMVDYSKLTPILTKAIQEQQAIIESQEQRIKKLEALVEQLLERK